MLVPLAVGLRFLASFYLWSGVLPRMGHYGAAAASLLVLMGCLANAAWAAPTESFAVSVREPAGIRRFQYPVAVALPASLPAEAGFRLRAGDDIQPAQFRRVTSDDGSGRWWLDFNIDLLPFETRQLVVEYGAELTTAGEPARGLTLADSSDRYQVINAPYIAWDIRRSPLNWLTSVKVPQFEHVRGEGARFILHGANETQHVLGSGQGEMVTMRVLRSGPLAMALQYDVRIAEGPFAETRSTIDLHFPVAKSWVEIHWQLEDPHDAVAKWDCEVPQNLEPPSGMNPVFIDFGASSFVYLMLGAGQSSELQSLATTAGQGSETQPLWRVLKGADGELQPFVTGMPASVGGGPAEGWAHVMDRTRCLALAVEDFGGGDAIRASASGAVRVRRERPVAAGSDKTKRLRTWLHFVGFPPQQSAATSPQSMQSPPVVTIP